MKKIRLIDVDERFAIVNYKGNDFKIIFHECGEVDVYPVDGWPGDPRLEELQEWACFDDENIFDRFFFEE